MAAVVAFVGVAGWSALARGTSGDPVVAGADGSVGITDTAGPPAQTTATTAATTVPRTPLTRELARGITGDDVRMVQQRLYDLGFDPGGVDGVYGQSTIQAVWAFEKLIMGTPRDQVTGHVTPVMWERMEQPLGVKPRRPNASKTHVEVYLPQQVLIVFRDNKPILISHISTGSDEHWCEVVKVDNDDGTETEKGVCGISKTPGGAYYFYRRKAGWWESELGRMWNPVYFNYGLAVHGAGNVPSYPASHGCVRVPLFHRQLLPEPGEVRRPDLRVRRREGARGVRQAAAAVQHAGPELHHDDLEHDDDNHDADDVEAVPAEHEAPTPEHAAAVDDDRSLTHHEGPGRR